MEQPATPSSRNGKNIATPKHRKKSPGDALGSGKSQVPITQYYSPVGSSSDRSSQPYSPIGCSPAVKRRTCVDSPQRKKKQRTKAAPLSQKQHIVVLSSEDSSDDFTQRPNTNAKPISPAVVPKARLNLIKRRLYPVTSSPIPAGSKSSRPGKKLSSKSVRKLRHQRKSRVLSDSESEEVGMDNSQQVPKRLQDAVQQSSQVLQVRRHLCPETSSQAVLISSSDESDFELHSSKRQSFLSQSLCGDTPQSPQSLLSQRNRRDDKKAGGSALVGKPPSGTQTFLKKPCSFGSRSDAAPSGSRDNDAKTPILNGCVVNISSKRHNKASLASPSLGSSDHAGKDSVWNDTAIKSESVDAKNGVTHEPRIPAQNPDLSTIYLQETLPLSPHHDCMSVLPETTEGHGKQQLNASPSRHVTHAGSSDSSSHPAFFPSPGHSIYDEETIDPRMNPEDTLDLHQTVDFSIKTFTNCESDAAALENQKTTSPVCSQRGAIIEASDDDEEESIMMQNQSDMQASENNRTSLGVVPLSELLDVSHISGSDASDSDGDDLSIIGGSIVTYPDYSEALATHMASLLVENSDESSAGITSILNSVLDASADFFSDIVSLSTGGSTAEQELIEDAKTPGMRDSARGPSPTEELVNIALAVAGLGGASGSQNSMDVESKCVDESHRHLQQSVAPEISMSDTSTLSMGCHPETEGFPEPKPSSLGVNSSHAVEVDNTPSLITGHESLDYGKDIMPETASSAHEKGDNASSNPLQSDPLCGVNADASVSESVAEADTGASKSVAEADPGASESMAEVDPGARESVAEADTGASKSVAEADPGASESMAEVDPGARESVAEADHGANESVAEADPAARESVAEADPAACETAAEADPAACETAAEADHASSSMLITEESTVTDLTIKGVSAETNIICGSQSPDELHITQHVEKTLLQNPNKPLLLDTIISECQNFADHVLSQEPLKTFVCQYSDLPHTTKAAFHCFLIELLEDSNRWLKYSEPFAGSIDDLVSSGILEYLNKNDNLIKKLNYLTFSEITEVLCKLGDSPSESIETMRNIVISKFTSAYSCERVKKEVTDLINRKFVKLTPNASFCIKMSLELFVLPLNLCDKFYKTVDVARFVNALMRDVSSKKVLLLPLRMSKMSVNERVSRDLSAVCRLKSDVLGSDLNDESIYLRLNDICSSIAVLDVSAEMDCSLRNFPTYRVLMANYVYALDEQLKSFLYLNISDIAFGACIYLGVLLKQNATGFQHKVKWCRERMRHLTKLFDPENVFEEFSKTLKEPVSPVEFAVRSEFVSSALKIKKLGLSPDEKSHLTRLLRPVSHKKTEICLVPVISCLNYYSVLTKKPKGKNFNLVRASIFQNYKTDFPCGVEDNGSLLLNAVFLAFWQAIYLNLDGKFVSKFQNCPLDWGSQGFFSERENYIKNLASEMQKHGLPAVFKLMKCIFEQFLFHRCVVDWQLVAPNMSKIQSLLGTLGMDKFLKISLHILGKLDERILGFPDIVLWNPESKTVKVLGLRKPSDPLYPHQILWLEKLVEFDVDAEELQIVGNSAPEQCSQVK